MKIAYSNLSCPEWTMEEVMANAARYGYDGVEIRLVDGEVIPPDLNQATQQKIVRLARDHHIEIVGLGASTRFAMADEREREHNVRELLAFLELAAKMEVPMVRTFGGFREEGDQASDAVQRLAESLNAVSTRAEQLGVDVLLETHDDFSASSVVKEVFRLVKSPRIGVLWDVLHTHRMGETVEESYRNLQNKIRHVHVKDAKRSSKGWDIVMLGEGEIPVAQVIAKLKQVGYDDYLSVEREKFWHPEIASANEAIPQHIEVLKKYLQQ